MGLRSRVAKGIGAGSRSSGKAPAARSGPGQIILRVVVVALWLLVTLVPLVALLLSSFKPTGDFYSPQFFPSDWTLQNYRQAFNQGEAMDYLGNSLIVAGATVFFSVSLGTMAAYGLARVRYAWAGVVVYAILAVRFYPKITVILPYYMMMRTFGLLDTLPAIIIAHVSITLPFVVLIMMTFFNEIPRSLEEAAAIDGATVIQRFRHVVLPLVRPALVTSAILTAMFSWNEFLMAVSVTSENAATLPVLVSSFISDKGIQLGQMAAVSVMIVIPIALFALVTQRYLIRGLTLGAVKE
jgi:multiple sugar transport system permease protein